MRHDRESIAWAIVWASFAVFCLLITAVILGGRWYLLNATDPQQAVLKVSIGTVAVHEAGKPDWVLATSDTVLKEGSAIRTERASQALIMFFDESTVTLLPETEVTFTTLRRSRYSLLAPPESRIRMVQSKGKTSIGVAPSGQGFTSVKVAAPQGTLSLPEGSYTLDVSSNKARVRVKEGGKATVTAQGKAVEVASGQRVDTYSGEAPHAPQPAAVELIANGDFGNGLEGWKADNTVGFQEGADVLGTVQTIQGGGSPGIRFIRTGSLGAHNETYIAQDLDEDVSDLTRLQLSLEFKLVKQSVSGGGYMGSEYPLLVRVHYRSDQGDTYVFRGFYYQNEANNRTDNGTQVDQDSWVTWTMPENLMTAVMPIPRKIIRIEVGASGHDYISEVRKISLSGE